ncbi:SDR family oxidoreductase [Leptospira licerasiae]|uniref:KR domain protein n=1 Tax=Leptospira licerasiae str. MMD4847 TaxID=1049971 RepID=A0ABP2R9R5_9LEPT|nr:SDR family oxidoreductase [Leptospira licerasiae]EIE02786.1 KR domain protein [Leptospira licerasiae serovar Varillal str. VAR 010]EJZ41083.1 KR domain protein [Leptospira licerasiae str. MMD4847]TGM89906.1 SDR family oxidoreductase [Leptospira licerasiae]
MGEFFKDKVVWITGASSGIGESLVKEAARRGATLVLSSRREKELKRVRKENGLTDSNSMILPLDLEDYKKLGKAPTQVIKTFGKIDVLINNGGISQRSLAHETSLETYETLMKVNYFGNIALTLAVLPHMRERKKGWISTIASVAGLIGVPLRTGYSSTKFALTGFYEALRAENTKENLKVTLVYPGFVKTNISHNALKGDGSPQKKMDKVIEQGIDADECARKILDAIENEDLQVIIAGGKEKFGLFLRHYFPKFFAKFLSKTAVT